MSKQLLRKVPKHEVVWKPSEWDLIFFRVGKIFTVTPQRTCKMIKCTFPSRSEGVTSVPSVFCLCKLHTFSHSVMLSVAVSKLGCTQLVLWNLAQDELLMQLLAAIRSIADDVYIFHQNNAPAHWARQTLELLRRETPEFTALDVWPPNSPDLNPVAYRIGEWCRNESTARHHRTWQIRDRDWWPRRSNYWPVAKKTRCLSSCTRRSSCLSCVSWLR